MNITFVALEKNNPEHVKLMWDVRSHPENQQFFVAPAPEVFWKHAKYLYELQGTDYYLLDTDEGFAGYAQISERAHGEREVGWNLAPGFWGKGIGSKAIDETIAICKQRDNTKRIFLSVLINNERAIHMYEKVGFVRTAEKEDGKILEMDLAFL